MIIPLLLGMGISNAQADILNDKRQLADVFLRTEGKLEPGQTPFRIDPKHQFKDTILGIAIDKTAKKTPETQNFYYVKPGTDISSMIEKQLELYAKRNPNITVKEAVYMFDKSHPENKIKELKRIGININEKLSKYF